MAPGYHFFSFSGPNYIDGQFEDVSNFRKAFCWKYFLLDKTNLKAKCNVFKIDEGKYCNRFYDAHGGTTSKFNMHLKNHHGIHADPLYDSQIGPNF